MCLIEIREGGFSLLALIFPGFGGGKELRISGFRGFVGLGLWGGGLDTCGSSKHGVGLEILGCYFRTFKFAVFRCL